MNSNLDTITSTNEDRFFAGLVHSVSLVLAYFTFFSAGLGAILVSLGIWLWKKDTSLFLRKHASEAFNFSLSMSIYAWICVLLSVITLGLGLVIVIPLIIIFALVWLICSIKAAIAGFDGREYRYPLTIRLLK